MKTLLFTLALLGISIVILYLVLGEKMPCIKPLHYTLGTFDSRFGISQADFLSALDSAEKLWESALGRNLFEYDSEHGTLPINLIFDKRQERTVENQKLTTEHNDLVGTQTYIQNQYSTVKAKLDVAKHNYDVMLNDFKRDLNHFNARVLAWNSGPRTDQSEITALQKEEGRLRNEEREIETTRLTVNTLVSQVNQYVKEEEKVIGRFNADLADFEDVYGTGETFFDQGLYTGDAINIYQFDDRPHLILALAHEFGHALGLSHVENPASLMYPIMGGQKNESPTLSREDRQELQSVCSVTRWDIFFRAWRQAMTGLQDILSHKKTTSRANADSGRIISSQ